MTIPTGLGAILAIIVLILCVVFAVIGVPAPLVLLGLIGTLAVARLC